MKRHLTYAETEMGQQDAHVAAIVRERVVDECEQCGGIIGHADEFQRCVCWSKPGGGCDLD